VTQEEHCHRCNSIEATFILCERIVLPMDDQASAALPMRRERPAAGSGIHGLSRLSDGADDMNSAAKRGLLAARQIWRATADARRTSVARLETRAGRLTPDLPSVLV